MLHHSSLTAFSACLALGGVMVGAGTASADFLYAADGALSSTGNLYLVDTNTALATSVGALVDAAGGAYSINGLAWDSSTNTLFGSTSGASPTLPNGIVRINPGNALVTPIGPLGFSLQNFAADLDISGGTLYGWAEGSLSALITINTTTGAGTFVGPNGQNLNTTGSGLASNAAGTMFSTPNLATGSIWQVNTASGQLFAPTPLSGGTPMGRIGALEFSSGTLFGVEIVGDGGSGISSNQLISINPLTGAINSIGQFRDANSLAFLRAIDALAIPTPGGAAILCFAGIFAVARRR